MRKSKVIGKPSRRAFLVIISLLSGAILMVGQEEYKILKSRAQPIIEDENSEPFFIRGHVKGGDGQMVSVHFPNEGLDFRKTAIIKDEQFVIQGKSNGHLTFELHFDKDLNTSVYWSPTFLVEDTIMIEGGLAYQQKAKYIKDFKIVKGDLNKEFTERNEKFFQDYPQKQVESDSIYKAHVVSHLIEKYDEIYYGESHPNIAIYRLFELLEEIAELNVTLLPHQKKAIKQFYDKIDTSRNNGSRFHKNLSVLIEKTISENIGLNFKDFELLDLDLQKRRITKYTRGKKIILVEFWWSHCIPCRKLNKDLKVFYDEYKDKGFEIISICSDPSIQRWKQASEVDEINWPNLLSSGFKSDCILYFEVDRYPSGLILDEKLEILQKGTIGKEDLKKILETSLN